MPAFKRLTPADQLDNVLVLQPRYELASGTGGWHGSPEQSGSLSLYGGARRRPGTFSSIEYQSHAPNVGQTGNPRRGQPITASVNLVYMTDETRNVSQRSATRWGKEHWDVVQRLYQDYHAIDADYVTSSYDHYCLFFHGTSRNMAVDPAFDTSKAHVFYPTGSVSVESWIKPFTLSRVGPDYTVVAFSGSFWLGLNASDGTAKLVTSFGQTVTSSVAPSIRRWNHLALSFDATTRTGSLLLNFSEVARFVSPSGSITANTGALGYLTFGNSTDALVGATSDITAVTGALSAFDGFLAETRVWSAARTQSQLSSTAFSRVTGGFDRFLSLMQFNEGPAYTVPPYLIGSGAIDQAGLGRNFGPVSLNSFNDRVGPVWHPSDNATFVVPKQSPRTQVLSGSAVGFPSEVHRMLVTSVPGAFTGRGIVPGSVRMTCRAFESFGLVRTLVDDGRGGLYLSGSACSSSLATREDYHGVDWTKVGNVFYGEGLAVIRDQSLLDFGRDDGAFTDPNNTFQLGFRGDSRVPVKTVMCRIDHGEFNCSTNPTFYLTGSAGERLRRHPSGSIRVSTVGLYNQDRDLVAVARLADPVRIRSRDRLNIRIRVDF